jgi:hypothetical protein
MHILVGYKMKKENLPATQKGSTEFNLFSSLNMIVKLKRYIKTLNR